MKRKLQIFVSSTFTDLIPERQAAVSAILKAGHIPAGMELFTAADRSQMDTIKRWIDESDVYMLILGGRYGSVESSSNKSYTELEYDYAIEKEKPLFAVVINEDALAAKVKSQGIEIVEMKNPKELASFRGKVLSNISSFFSDEKDIKLCVHESLSDYASNRSLKGWVSASEIPDVETLVSEISKLQKENESLQKQLSKSETSLKSKGGITEETFLDIKNVLKTKKIEIPANISSSKESYESNIFNVFVSNSPSMVKGITNSAQNTPTELFYYHKICPILQIHGLVENEKVPSVRYRRYFVTKKGIEFLAQHELLQAQNADKK